MTSSALFLSSIPFDAAIVTANSELGSLPALNLQFPEPDRVWRSANHTPRVVIQLATALAVNALAVIAHNGAAAATYKIKGGPTLNSVTGVSAATLDTGFISMWPVSGKPVDSGLPHLSSLAMFANATPCLYWSVEFNDATNTDNFEAARIMLDTALRLKVGAQIGLQVSTTGSLRIGDFNRIFGDARGPNSRLMTIPFNAINKIDFRKYLFPYQLRHGVVKDFFFSADPTYDDDFCLFSMQCLFGNSSAGGSSAANSGNSSMSAFTRQAQYDGDGAMWVGHLSLLEWT